MKVEDTKANNLLSLDHLSGIIMSISNSKILSKRKAVPGNCMALYAFYLHIANIHKTRVINSTTKRTASFLHWSTKKVRETKYYLKRWGLIRDIHIRQDGKISGARIELLDTEYTKG